MVDIAEEEEIVVLLIVVLGGVVLVVVDVVVVDMQHLLLRVVQAASQQQPLNKCSNSGQFSKMSEMNEKIGVESCWGQQARCKRQERSPTCDVSFLRD